MKHVLILGAGRSSGALIEEMIRYGKCRLTVADQSQAVAEASARGRARAVAFEAGQPGAAELIAEADCVISLLPPVWHAPVAQHCLQQGISLFTASYVSAAMQALDRDARAAGVLLLNECGLDPGIDHMSAMEMIDQVRAEGGVPASFESYTGGLIAPATDPDNPWRYKFTWNPRNVVTAGQGTAIYLEGGRPRYLAYPRLFQHAVPVQIAGLGHLEGYANRDSLRYRDVYRLPEVDTLIRGTLRFGGYCAAWHILAYLGCCDDTYTWTSAAEVVPRDFINSFLPGGSQPPDEKIAHLLHLDQHGPEIARLRWSGFFDERPLVATGSPAAITEAILNLRWKLKPEDRDLIVMWHRLHYRLGDGLHVREMSLQVTGDAHHTAMAKTVGLPLAFAAQLWLEGKIQAAGVQLPVEAAIYKPLLSRLAGVGIELKHRHV